MDKINVCISREQIDCNDKTHVGTEKITTPYFIPDNEPFVNIIKLFHECMNKNYPLQNPQNKKIVDKYNKAF